MLDVIKEQSFTVQCYQRLKKGNKYLILTPEGKKINYVNKSMKDIFEKDIDDSKGQKLVKFPWVKRVIPGSIIIREK